MSKLSTINAFAATLVAGTLGVSAAQAAGNPFAATDLPGGYQQLASNHGDKVPAEGKCGEGKCGEGKCGGTAGDAKQEAEGKCGEGKCGEGKCGAMDESGATDTPAPAADGNAKAGEGACGNHK